MIIILFVEDPKDFTLKKKKKLWELINKCSNIAGYKINKQKSISFQYTSNELSKT